MRIEDAVRKIPALDKGEKVKFPILYGSHTRGDARTIGKFEDFKSYYHDYIRLEAIE